MATELKPTPHRTGELMLTAFFGGKSEGRCIQLTPRCALGGFDTSGYVQLNKSQARELAAALIEFADDVREEA